MNLTGLLIALIALALAGVALVGSVWTFAQFILWFVRGGAA